jgi:hypothetical protein
MLSQGSPAVISLQCDRGFQTLFRLHVAQSSFIYINSFSKTGSKKLAIAPFKSPALAMPPRMNCHATTCIKSPFKTAEAPRQEGFWTSKTAESQAAQYRRLGSL